MEGIPIRNARRGDIPALLMLWTAMRQENARLDPRLAMHPHAKEHQAQQFGTWLHENDRVLVVAEEGSRLIVGYAAGRVAPGTGWHRPEHIGEVTDLFVASPRRRRGLARRMVGRIGDMLYELNVDTVRLQVAARNDSALAFWRAIGWDVLEEILEWPGEIPAAPDVPGKPDS